MSFTVVPLHNLSLPEGTKIPFGKGFILQEVPDWVKKDEGTLKDINRHDRQATLDAKHALVVVLEWRDTDDGWRRRPRLLLTACGARSKPASLEDLSRSRVNHSAVTLLVCKFLPAYLQACACCAA